MADGALALQLAEDSADALAAIEARAERETSATLRLALAAVLAGLRRAFVRYQEAVANPGSVSPAELTARYQEVVRTAQRFLTDGELNSWEASYRRHLEAAVTAGAKAAELQQKADDPASVPPPFPGPDPVVIEAQLRATTASLQQERAGFREQLVALVAIAALQGWGTRRLEQEARRALEGIADPRQAGRGAGGRPAGPGAAPAARPASGAAPGSARTAQAAAAPAARRAARTAARRPQAGIVQRVAVAVRSNLQSAYQQLNLTVARAAGFQYARWIATRDERTCAYCVARHGRIYRLDQIGLPAHRRCRCQAAVLSTDDVENPDPAERERALNGNFWRQSQTRLWREYAASRGRSTADIRPELLRAAATPTATERWRTPGIRSTAQPVVTLDGPGGQDLTSAVRRAASNANRQQPR